ncbi:MAG: hypothetical protein KGI33_05045 [Thaumarchaeota archaeon]|nr:hypothetical protein [Nitrososphaerota archaeon]
MTSNYFRTNKTKTATSVITALVIGLALLSPTTMIPNVNATSAASSTTGTSEIGRGHPTPLSPAQLAQAENIALNDPAVIKLIGSKPYQIRADGFAGNIKQSGVWNPVLALVVDSKSQYAIGVNLGTGKVTKIVEGPTTDNVFSISNSNAHDTITGSTLTPVGIQMTTTEPYFYNNPSYNYTGFMVNALEYGASLTNACNPSYGNNDYFMQAGEDFNTQSSPAIFWDDTFYSCVGQPTLISYATGQSYNFTITTDKTHSQWTVTITDGSGNVYTVSDTGMSQYTIAVQLSYNHTSVWFENSNTKTTSPSWDSQFTYNPSAKAKIEPQGSGWTNWTSETQGEYQSCSTNQTPSVISGGLDNGNSATWSLSTMRQYYPAC